MTDEQLMALVKGATPEAVGLRKAAGEMPPSGYTPIPGGAHGGYRKKRGVGWAYWYPSGTKMGEVAQHHATQAAHISSGSEQTRAGHPVDPDKKKQVAEHVHAASAARAWLHGNAEHVRVATSNPNTPVAPAPAAPKGKQPKTHKITDVGQPDGRDVPTTYRAGIYAVHKEDWGGAKGSGYGMKGMRYSVTHVPTGMRVSVHGHPKDAQAAADHMHTHAGNAGADTGFGVQPSGPGWNAISAAHSTLPAEMEHENAAKNAKRDKARAAAADKAVAKKKAADDAAKNKQLSRTNDSSYRGHTRYDLDQYPRGTVVESVQLENGAPISYRKVGGHSWERFPGKSADQVTKRTKPAGFKNSLTGYPTVDSAVLAEKSPDGRHKVVLPPGTAATAAPPAEAPAAPEGSTRKPPASGKAGPLVGEEGTRKPPKPPEDQGSLDEPTVASADEFPQPKSMNELYKLANHVTNQSIAMDDKNRADAAKGIAPDKDAHAKHQALVAHVKNWVDAQNWKEHEETDGYKPIVRWPTHPSRFQVQKPAAPPAQPPAAPPTPTPPPAAPTPPEKAAGATKKAPKAKLPKTHKITDGAGGVEAEHPTVGGAGHYLIHKKERTSGKKVPQFVVSHAPSGYTLRQFPYKKDAQDYADHMHTHAGDAGGDTQFGKHPEPGELSKIKSAFDKYMDAGLADGSLKGTGPDKPKPPAEKPKPPPPPPPKETHKIMWGKTGGTKDVETVHSAGAYKIHDQGEGAKADERYVITHGPSGMALTQGHGSLEEAKGLAEHMAKHANITAGEHGQFPEADDREKMRDALMAHQYPEGEPKRPAPPAPEKAKRKKAAATRKAEDARIFDLIKGRSLHELRMTPASELAKAGGEGSRGGHVTGHTASGQPIYAHGGAAKHIFHHGQKVSTGPGSEVGHIKHHSKGMTVHWDDGDIDEVDHKGVTEFGQHLQPHVERGPNRFKVKKSEDAILGLVNAAGHSAHTAVRVGALVYTQAPYQEPSVATTPTRLGPPALAPDVAGPWGGATQPMRIGPDGTLVRPDTGLRRG